MRRGWLAIGGCAALLAAALLFPPAQFLADRVEIASAADLGALVTPVEWVPVWRLGPGVRGTAHGHYELLGLLLAGELCVLVAVGAAAGMSVTARTRGTAGRSPPAAAP